MPSLMANGVNPNRCGRLQRAHYPRCDEGHTVYRRRQNADESNGCSGTRTRGGSRIVDHETGEREIMRAWYWILTVGGVALAIAPNLGSGRQTALVARGQPQSQTPEKPRFRFERPETVFVADRDRCTRTDH